MISEDELREAAEEEDTSSAEDHVDARQQTRYLLLKADCDLVEGDVVLQPWLVVEQPDLATADLCRDWIGALNSLGLTHISERLDDLAAGGPMMPSDRILFAPGHPKKRET